MTARQGSFGVDVCSVLLLYEFVFVVKAVIGAGGGVAKGKIGKFVLV